MKISIVEVGPRDGLQNEVTALSVTDRVDLLVRLAKSGLKKIEAGAFVSPQKIPQMASTSSVFEEIHKFSLNAQFSALVPNEQGMADALRARVSEVAIFTAVSETFTRKNINCTIDESFERFIPVVREAKKNKVKVRAYLSTCFGCPYEGEVDPKSVVRLSEKLLRLGAYEVSVGDTIGVANPKQVKNMLKLLYKKIPPKKLAMHFHDTRGTALANIFASFQEGITTFDSSVGGLGGCPYAPGASGNVATEDVVYMLHGMGVQTGIQISQLLEINAWLSRILKRQLPSKLGQAGLPKVRLIKQ